jgi:hypothetical protein
MYVVSCRSRLARHLRIYDAAAVGSATDVCAVSDWGVMTPGGSVRGSGAVVT